MAETSITLVADIKNLRALEAMADALKLLDEVINDGPYSADWQGKLERAQRLMIKSSKKLRFVRWRPEK